MTQEEKYKLALFAVIRNSSVMANIIESCDFEKLKAAYEAGKNWN